jgi:uncharacterized membrane protein YhaH (DUF805 family)
MLQNFLGFDGRIGRQSWWIGVIILTVASLVFYFILNAIMGVTLDPAKLAEPGFLESYMRTASIMQLILLAIIGYPYLSLLGKRLNDRDRPSWMKFLFIAPSVLSAILGVLGLAYTTSDVGGGVMMPTPSMLGWILSILSIVLGIWGLIECGFLRGTDGDNQHGPDPLAE